MSQPRILMCSPDYYNIEYEINPWMSRERDSVLQFAIKQWQKLYDTLVQLGVEVELLTPQPGLPDLVFTANAGVVYRNQFVSSCFRHEVRAKESPFFDQWFQEHGFQVHHLPAGTYFEGAGDALFCGTALFAGYRIRSDIHGQQQLGNILGIQVLPMELVDKRFYHLDTCFCPLAPGEAMYHPGAFDDYGKRVLETHIPNLLTVEETEAVNFGCNAVVIGKTVILNEGCGNLLKDLERRGYQPITLNLGEFLKSGGSAKCLTIRLDGEEAALWKNSDE